MRPLRHLADMHSRARLRGSHPGSARPSLSRFGQCDCPAIPIGSIHPRCEVMRSRGCAVRESCTPASAGRVFFPHMRADDVIYPRPALRRDVPRSPFTPTGSASAHRRGARLQIPGVFFVGAQQQREGGELCGGLFSPDGEFTDSCGRPRVPGAIHIGCAHSQHTQCAHTSRRAFLKGGIAIVGGAGMATIVDPGEVFAQVRVFPPPPPAVSPIAGLMDTHVHSAPDVFVRALADEEVTILYKDRGLEALVLKNHVLPTADRAWLARKHVAGLKVFGGVVLNSPAGGINPDAVNWMWRMQGGYGRVVWFPTFDADNHVK